MTELTEREKFIQHYVTLSTMRILAKRIAEGNIAPESLIDIGNVDSRSDIGLIRKTRCRKMSDEELEDLIEGLSQEALLGGSVLNDMLE